MGKVFVHYTFERLFAHPIATGEGVHYSLRRDAWRVFVYLVGVAMCAVALLLCACGVSPQDAAATQTNAIPATLTTLSVTPPRALVPTADDAIAIARRTASLYLSTWRDVTAQQENGVWLVVFRNYDPAPPRATPDDTYFRTRFTVRIDAATGVVLSQGYE